jgi:transglutaminase-like putative cysteine protease
MDRRRFLKSSSLAGLAVVMPGLSLAAYSPAPSGWRRFVLTTTVELPRDGAGAQAWVPVPSIHAEDWSRPGETTWTGTATRASLETDAATGAQFVHAVWEPGTGPATLEVVSSAETQDRAVPGARSVAPLSDEERARHLAPTELIPTDGIVRETAEQIVAGATGDAEKAQRIYDWVVESTERDPETRGCGLGDIASMLHTGDLTGKCADLNALYVGLARAAGLPARDLYGLRVAPSAFGYKSLGAGSEVVTKAQHCRAEVWLDARGWVPVDPADVRKVVLEEPPKTLTLADREVQDVRAALFGASEGNWLCYNDAHDIVLPGSTQGPIPFLMYPQAEIDGVARDEFDPDDFAYSITVREIL